MEKKGTIKIIQMNEKLVSEDEYRKSLKRFLEICNCKAGSPESEELKQLTALMEIYEQENCQSEYSD